MRVKTLAAAALLLASGRLASPTSVVAPGLDDLVARAETVVVAEVVDIRSSWIQSRPGRAIVTDVTFAIERTLKGRSYAQRSLEFLGGTVGDVTLHVAGMPVFQVGDRDLLFIRDSGRPVSPVVGFMYGRFRVVRDANTGVEMIRTHDGRPVGSVADIGNGQPAALAALPHPLSLDEFVRAVAARVAALESAR